MGRRSAQVGIGIVLGALLAGGLTACGRYGPPVRAEEYREAQKQKKAEEAARKKKSPEETNEPLPASP